MIHELRVKNLNNRHTLEFKFHEDLNLFTGKNGCGKTTILKIIWYLTSGNIEQVFREINFDHVYFSSDEVEADLTKSREDKYEVVHGFYELKKGVERTFEGNRIRDIEGDEILNNPDFYGNSLFFPTFRRIEGGYSIDTDPREEYVYHRELRQRVYMGRGEDLNSALNEISSRITPNRKNRFIASISTNDIIRLLDSKYTEILEQIRRLENRQSQLILGKIRKRKEEKNILDQIESVVEKTDRDKEYLLKPFSVLSHLIQDIFLDKSIRISRTVTLGEAKDAILSEKLSAGEKQMLSFLCYNFFSDNSSIFIDEPELSLHTDWQRILFPTLLEQGTSNQFFVATHSPFIYSKYSDKEHVLDVDRGGNL